MEPIDRQALLKRLKESGILPAIVRRIINEAPIVCTSCTRNDDCPPSYSEHKWGESCIVCGTELRTEEQK